MRWHLRRERGCRLLAKAGHNAYGRGSEKALSRAPGTQSGIDVQEKAATPTRVASLSEPMAKEMRARS